MVFGQHKFRHVTFLIAIIIGLVVFLGTFLFQPAIPAEVLERETVYDQEFLDGYFFILAQKTGNTAYCNNMTSSVLCRATIEKKPEMCQDIEGPEQKECLFFATKNISYCPYLQEYCRAIIEKDPSLCANFQGFETFFSDSCKAEVSLNETYFLERHQESLGRALFEIAVEKNDPRLCRRIEHQEYRRMCERRF